MTGEQFITLVGNHPGLSLVTIIAGYYSIKMLIRCVNILLRGWPPAHLDADGDFKREREDTHDPR